MSLFEESFGCTLSSIAFLKAVVSVVWVEHSEVGFCGAALVEQQVHQNYLSKFAVTPMVRGDGVAKLMWEALCDTHPSFFGERVRGIHFRLGTCAGQMVMSRVITGRYFGMDWRPKKRKRL